MHATLGQPCATAGRPYHGLRHATGNLNKMQVAWPACGLASRPGQLAALCAQPDKRHCRLALPGAVAEAAATAQGAHADSSHAYHHFLAAGSHQYVPTVIEHAFDMELQQESRAVGCVLAAMCGNVLGAPLQHDRHWQVARMFPDGLTEFWGQDLASKRLSLGQATGEFQLMLAVAHSLASAHTCDVTQIAKELADRCDTHSRRFNPYSEQLILQLQEEGRMLSSVHWLSSLPLQAAEDLSHSPAHAANSFSDRFDREPFGPADNSAACSVAPLALAYRTADWAVLEQAVQEMCILSHSHPVGIDGARVMAAAVHWLLKQTSQQQLISQDRLAAPRALLQHLQTVASTVDMRNKLALLDQALFEVDEITSWRTFYRSAQWHQVRTVLSRITYHDYATSGTEATSVALWALLTNWHRPQQALCMAVAMAGSVPVTSQMAGALVGALHGHEWIPATWWSQLENGQGSAPQWAGRDAAVALAKQLAGLKCDSVGLQNAASRNQ